MSRNFAHIFDEKSNLTRRKRTTSQETHPVSSYIGVGSNHGSRRRIIERALAEIKRTPGILLDEVSSLYETEPVGGPVQQDHLNGVIRILTLLKPDQLWSVLKRIERHHGRRRGVRWGSRSLDLDILTFGRARIKSKRLSVPHPRYTERRFVMVPFTELAPHFRHPVLNRSNRTLLRRLTLSGQRVTMLARWKNGRFYPFKKRKS